MRNKSGIKRLPLPCASTHHKQNVDDDQNDSDDVGAHVQIAPHDDDQYRMYRRLARSVNNLNTRVLQLLTKTEFRTVVLGGVMSMIDAV